MFPVLQIGPAVLPTPALIILFAVWLGLTFSERFSTQYKVDPDKVYNLVLLGLVSGAAGGRMVYAAGHLGSFLQSPLNLFSRNPGLFDPLGGMAVGALAMLIYGNRKKQELWPVLDALTPLLAVIAVGIGLSHLASGEAFGRETSLPWGIQLWGMKRHPSQIYETLAALLVLWMIWPRKGKAGLTRWGTGRTFLAFLALSAAARLFLEAFRGDSIILIGNIRTTQVLSWLVLSLSLWGLGKFKNQKQITN